MTHRTHVRQTRRLRTLRLAVAALVLACYGLVATHAPASAAPDPPAGSVDREPGLVLRPAPVPVPPIKLIPGLRMNTQAVFRIQSAADARFCLDADFYTRADPSRKVQMWACNPDFPDHQLWGQAWGDNGRMFLVLVDIENGLRCLDADVYTIGRNGTKVHAYQCTTAANQGWKFEMDSAAFWHLRVDVHPRRSLDADVYTLGQPGSLVHLWDYRDGAKNQGWVT